jgi:hypothetical protein
MSQAHIDENDVKTWLAYNETTSLVENVRVEPITGALMVYGVPPCGDTPNDLNNAKIDENDVKTLLGYNETTGLVEALRCCDDGLLVTVVT